MDTTSGNMGIKVFFFFLIMLAIIMILTLLSHTIEKFAFSNIEKKVALYSSFSVLLDSCLFP